MKHVTCLIGIVLMSIAMTVGCGTGSQVDSEQEIADFNAEMAERDAARQKNDEELAKQFNR